MEKRNSSTNALIFTETFGHDADGNLITRFNDDTGVTVTYGWDDFNKLIAVSSAISGVPSTDPNDPKQENHYGVNGFRRKKKAKSGVVTTEYATGLATAVAKGAGDPISYIQGPQILGFEKGGEFFWYLHDQLGSVRDICSGTDGAVLQSYDYTENGDKTTVNSSGPQSAKTWVGGLSVNDDVGDSGLYLMGHRHYDPSTARFLSRDPIGFDGGMNLYSYGNSPVTSVDPSGLTSISALGWAFGRGAAIGAITTLVAVGLVTFGGALGAGIVTTAAIAGAGIFVADASVRIITGRGYSATEASEMAGGLVAGGAITRGFRSRLHSETPEQMTLKQPCSDPIIGSKLDYAFGKATGRQHNITRSLENLRQLERIGLPDNASNRAYLQSHFESVYRDPRSIELRDGAFTTRISLLMGPEGGLRVKSIWVDPQLISMIFQGKGR